MTTQETPCPACDRNQDGICSECYINTLTEMARLSSFEHLLHALLCLFCFEFKGLVVELVWAVERLFEVGDYGPNGHFDELKIDWRKRT